MRLLATLLVALLSVQVHLGQETGSQAKSAKLRQLNNYKQWAAREAEEPSAKPTEVPHYTPASPKLKKHPNKWAQYSPRRKRKTQSEQEAYQRVRQGRNGRIRPAE